MPCAPCEAALPPHAPAAAKPTPSEHRATRPVNAKLLGRGGDRDVVGVGGPVQV
jgi:hypothetical protein